jgi:hypothetical protein
MRKGYGWERALILLDNQGLSYLPIVRVSAGPRIVIILLVLVLGEALALGLLFTSGNIVICAVVNIVAVLFAFLLIGTLNRNGRNKARFLENAFLENGPSAVQILNGQWSRLWSDIATVEVGVTNMYVLRVDYSDGNAHSFKNVWLTKQPTLGAEETLSTIADEVRRFASGKLVGRAYFDKAVKNYCPNCNKTYENMGICPVHGTSLTSLT